MLKSLRLAAVVLLASCGTNQAPLDEPDASVPPPADASSSPDAGSGRPDHLATACFRYEADCHPVDGVGCGAESRCDFALDTAALRLVCHSAEATRGLGETCSDAARTFCMAGLRCHEGTCKPTCCEDEACTGSDEICVAHDVAWGSLGVCTTPPACRESGADCARSSECCSNDCHAEHCH